MMTQDIINVAETFYSVQGEGLFTGTPSVFLRLQSCNLNCTWCDTTEVWRRGTPMHFDDLYNLWYDNGWIDLLENRKCHLVITGGEPILRQTEVLAFLESQFHGRPWIEIETNATLLPSQMFNSWVHQYNCSPKLSNSGMAKEKRHIQSTIEWHATNRRSVFKFVVRTEQDVIDAETEYITPYGIPNDRVYLMPQCQTKKELDEWQLPVVELCKKFGYNYSNRLHIQLWNRTTGV